MSEAKHTSGAMRAAEAIYEIQRHWILAYFQRLPRQRNIDKLAELIDRETAAPEMLEALEALEAALREDSRNKDILGDEVEYHLDGQTMGWAIEKVRAAIRKAKGE